MFSSNTSQVSNDATYIEDVFSTWLYTGNGNAGLTINNGIDLSGKGGLTWLKKRSAAGDNYLYDTARGASNALVSNTTAAAVSDSALNGFTSTGFTLAGGTLNDTYASWTFRKQPKFFDVVTYTGNGNTGAGQDIPHNLGSVPGCIIIKATSTTGNWLVYHRSTPSAGGAGPGAIYLNTTAARSTTNSAIGGATATSFNVGVNTAITAANTNGVTYVAYLFAHNAGGFGLTGTDNVISCGSYTGTGSDPGPEINLGFEPQWLLIKNASAAADWNLGDTMRGMYAYANANDAPDLFPNSSSAEVAAFQNQITSTGFRVRGVSAAANQSGNTYIYIAIRRGPMKTPTSGTSVFSPQLEGGTAGTQITTNFPIDWQLIKQRSAAQTIYGITRLTGVSTNTTEAAGYLLQTASTAAELADATSTRYWNNTGFQVPSNFSGGTSTAYISENFRRAPGFFDVVCYTGTGSARTVTHNLGVVPELIITKRRDSTSSWITYSALGGIDNWLTLNLNEAFNTSSGYWGSSPTASVFGLGATSGNLSGGTYVAYLFASCPGVSKVGSYTGTGATQTISCGFAARFVLIKRTDSTGDWWIWDTARGMVAGTDPRMATNSATAETNANWVYTNASGFQIVTTDASVNASGGSYIFLAIA